MLSHIEIKNLRALRHVGVRIGEFQVCVGPNASGKSTFFDAIALLRDVLLVGIDSAVRGNIRFGVPMRAADPRDLTWERQGGTVEIAITAQAPARDREGADRVSPHVRYEIAIDTTGELAITAENLWLVDPDAEHTMRGRGKEPRQTDLFPEDISPMNTNVVWPPNTRSPRGWRKIVSKSDAGNDYFRSETSKWNNQFRLGPSKSALANLPEDEERFPTATWFKRWLMEGTHTLVLNAEAMRMPSPAGASTTFQPDGSNLPWVVHDLRTRDSERLGEWLDHLRTSLPDIKDVRTEERIEDRARYLVVDYASGLSAPSWLLSDGTLRMMALTLLAYVDHSASLLLIEEPENGIHPRAVETVVQSLGSIYGGQVFCATHSPLVLSAVELDALLCFGKTSTGAVDVIRGSEHPVLKSWKSAVHLGDLLAMGVLG